MRHTRRLEVAAAVTLVAVLALIAGTFQYYRGLNDALARAISQADRQAIRGLLERGADPETRGREGRTALMTAAASGDLPLVRLVLARGARVNAEDGAGFSALMNCEDPQVMVALLDAGADVNAHRKDGFTILMGVAALGKVEAARVLLAHGADVKHRDGDRATALTYAELGGNSHLVRLLREAGAPR